MMAHKPPHIAGRASSAPAGSADADRRAVRVAAPVSTDPLAGPTEPSTLPPSPAVTWLKVVGAPTWLKLDRTRFAFTLGSAPSSHVDLSLPLRYVSRLHCRLERDGDWLVVSNHSQNGTYFDGQRKDRQPLKVGECFTVGSTPLLALDDYGKALHATLQRALGYTADAAIDEAQKSVAKVGQPPLVLTGPPGCEPERLARAIHEGSPRRALPFVELDPRGSSSACARAVGAAQGGTLYVDLRAVKGRKLPAKVLAIVFAKDTRCRQVLAAPSLVSALAALDGRAARPEEIAIPAVATRGHDVPALLDALLAEQGASQRFVDLPLDRQEALCAFEWPENHEDLRRTAPRLAAYLAHDGNVSAAARTLGVDDSTLAEALRRVGILAPRVRAPWRLP